MAAPQMRSQRLTHDLRHKIVNAAVKDVYGEEEKKLRDAENAIARRIYEVIYTPARLEECRRDNGRPSPFGVPFELRNLTGDARVYYLYGFECYSNVAHVVESTAIYNEYLAFETAKQKFSLGKEEMLSALWKLLNSCSTTKQLLEYWPDGKNYIPKAEEKAAGQFERDRRLAAAKVAGIFLDAGIDVVTPTEVEPDAGEQDQAA